MRGRTNIGGGGIAINATVEQKTIKSGNIIAGDFVEYFSEDTTIEPNAFFDFRFVSNGFLIAQIGTLLTAFKDGRQVATYAGYNCYNIGQSGEHIVFYDPLANVVGVLSITDTGFTLLDSYSVTPRTSSSSYCAIWGNDNKICYVMWDKNSSNRKFYIGVFDKANDGTLSNYHETELAGSTSSNNKIEICYYGGYFYIFIYGSYSPVNFKLSINEGNVVTIDQEITQSGYCSISPRIVYKKGQILGIASHEGNQTSTSTSNQGYLSLFNFVTGNFNQIALNSYGEILSIVNDSLVITSERTSESNSWRTHTMHLCRFDDLVLTLTILDTIVFSEQDAIKKSLDATLGGIENNIVYAQLKGGTTSQTSQASRTISLFEIINNNHIQYPTQKNYVQTYENGNPIGVAKDSGSVGDIIDVYIPAVSS